MTRLGEAIKCYSFQSWPLEPILRDPLCIMKMVHMMIKKSDICISNHLSSLTFSHLIAEQKKCVSVVAALRAEQGPWEPIKGCIREIREQ